MSNIIENTDIEIDFSLEELKELDYQSKKNDILTIYSLKMKQLVSKYTEEEQKTWNTQLEEAKAYLADNSASVPMLTEIADGVDIGILAQKIVDKATFLQVESGKLLAWKNRELK